MTTVVKPQAVSGVSAGVENEIETVYPSIAASGLGRLLGSMMNLFPGQCCGVRFSHLLMAPIVIPLAAVGYFKLKFFDPKYTLTNRSLQVRGSLSNNLEKQVPLTDIDNVDIQVRSGQEFYHAADLEILDARGDSLLTLTGIPYPHRMRQIILDARDARRQNDAALKTIESRST